VPSHSPRKQTVSEATIRARRIRVLAGAAVVVVVAAVLAVVLSGSSSKKPTASTTRPGRTTGSSTTPTSAVPTLASDRCPLTDTPAPGGVVPKRPPLAVKIGNQPVGARPQSGLSEADVVYDTPAEGGIMRYVAVYQCENAPVIGPVRSLRWVDWHILAEFRTSLLAFAGGINPDVNVVESLRYVKAIDLLTNYSQAGYRTTNRVPPDNLYTSSSTLWKLFPSLKTPPQPIFQYSSALPAGSKPASSITLNFSAGTDVLWKWQPSTGTWLHTYSGVPDVDAATNQPITATNVVVQIVHYSYGPYPESPGATGDVESKTTGTGPGYVFRNGRAIAVTWHRKDLSAPTTFTSATGQPVGLAPGKTWVELLLDTTAKVPGAFSYAP
jgi:hypothetical protein